MRRLDFLLTGFLAVLLTSCGQRVQNTDSKPAVKIDTVLSADRQIALQFPGRVKAAQDISLSFRVSGTIQYMHVNDGAYVRKGQLLAELDPTDYQIQLDAAEAEYQSVKAEAERVMALYKENVTTPDANDKAVYGLRQITAKYNHAKDQLAYTRLYAPFNGYVQKRLFDSHETVAAGMPSFPSSVREARRWRLIFRQWNIFVDSSLPATIVHSIFILIKDMLWN